MISSLSILKDVHKNKRFWICGSGPSLVDVNPKLIPKEDIVICCNSSTFHFQNFNYGIFTDEMANYSEWYLNLDKKECDIILCNSRIKKIKDNTLIFEKIDSWLFDNEDKVICGYDIIHCSTHIAYVMGACEIILVGVDLKHKSPTEKYPYEQGLIDSTPIHLRKIVEESSLANNTLTDTHLSRSLAGWGEIVKNNKNLNIIDISLTGNLNFFKKHKFEDLIK